MHLEDEFLKFNSFLNVYITICNNTFCITSLYSFFVASLLNQVFQITFSNEKKSYEDAYGTLLEFQNLL